VVDGPWLGPLGPWQNIAGYRRPRGIPYWLLWITLRGRGRVICSSGPLITAPGDVVLIRPRTRLDYGAADATTPWVGAWCAFEPRPHWRSWLRWPEVGRGTMRLEIRGRAARRTIAAGLTAARAIMGSAMRQRSALAMHELERILLCCDPENPLSDQARIDPRVITALEFISDHLAESVSLDELASASGVSVAQLCRLFKKQIGISPSRYLEGERLSRAAELLQHTSLRVAEVARAVGYDNPFYFSTRFRRRFRRAPSADRRG